MTELMRRRRALMAVNGDGKIWLYRNGFIAPFLGGLTHVGYSESSAYNKKAFEATYLRIWNTNAAAGSAFKGGKSFTSNSPLPSNLLGKTVHVIGYHSNTATTNIDDIIGVYISETAVNSTSRDAAYPNSINSTIKKTSAETDLTPFELILPITKIGLIAVASTRGRTGIYEVQFTEMWVE